MKYYVNYSDEGVAYVSDMPESCRTLEFDDLGRALKWMLAYNTYVEEALSEFARINSEEEVV